MLNLALMNIPNSPIISAVEAVDVPSRINPRLFTWIFLNVLSCTIVLADDAYVPQIAAESRDAELAIERFQIPAGMKAELFAAEPLLANPVTFAIDEQGRIFVAETFRQEKGVEDNRNHSEWLLDDLAAQTVEDRIAFFKKHLKENVQKYAIEHDRIRLLQDTDGDGRCDRSTVFADGFNRIEHGTGAGVLSFEGKVYYTCIPKLWQLMDKDGDGQSDICDALHDGFGVRVAFRGHDLHGLIIGPDGRLYFSLGDRGYNVQTPNGRLIKPDQGAVFRCQLDGTELEVFATGLRNPQELAFDDYGNLFTCDNNSDSDDEARCVYLIEGSDSGWRMYYQYLPDRGPWNRERLWYPSHPGQAAYIVPPIDNIADGPAGLTYYPGTGLDEKYRGHFFLADFGGSNARSGIRSFSLIPYGASFELTDAQKFIWSIMATDVDFGFDGGIYVSDWVEGWVGAGKGRLYRFRSEQHGTTDVVAEVGRLMREGFAHRDPAELGSLLAYPDYRIRLRAQFALVNKGTIDELLFAATNGKSLFARLHGIWGLGQLGRSKPEALMPLLKLADDQEPEVRSQLARVCGDVKLSASEPVLVKLLKDPSPRVRSLAAIAVGKLKAQSAVEPLFELLDENSDLDSTLRHTAVMGLVGADNLQALLAARQRPLRSGRMGAVLALRRLGDAGLTDFLNDPDPLIVLEAARAIHDLPIVEALPSLAALTTPAGTPEPLLRRVLNANYRLGGEDNARVVASAAADPNVDESLRLEAIGALMIWNSPSPLDRILNDYRPLPMRSIDVVTIVRPFLGSLFSSGPALRVATAELVARYGDTEAEPYLLEIANNDANSSEECVAAIKTLATLNSPKLREVVEIALGSNDPDVRSEARRQLLAGLNPPRAVTLLAAMMDDDSIPEQQSAIATLAEVKRDDADQVLEDWLNRLVEHKVSDEIQLDLLEAASVRGTKQMLSRLEEFNAARNPDDRLRDYRETLSGGDVERGAVIFYDRIDVSCKRCHKIDEEGGEVGPNLSRIEGKSREYLLEAIVDPNRQIAKGFETTIVQMDDGTVHAGIIKSDDGAQITIQKPDGSFVRLDKAKIEEQTVGKSGMPEDLVKKLSKRDLRDLVEFLASRRPDDDPTSEAVGPSMPSEKETESESADTSATSETGPISEDLQSKNGHNWRFTGLIIGGLLALIITAGITKVKY